MLSLRKVKNEDCVAVILTKKETKAYYRFFGARHSILQVGNLIDFETEENSHFIPRLRNLSQIHFPWLFEKNRLLLWHNFIKLFEPHLKDAQEIETFYYDLLLDAAKKWHKQNPKRIVCENYLALLIHEGRLHKEEICYICERPIEEEMALMRAFIPAHPECLHSASLSKEKMRTFFKTGKTTHLDDSEVAYLYDVAMKGF